MPSSTNKAFKLPLNVCIKNGLVQLSELDNSVLKTTAAIDVFIGTGADGFLAASCLAILHKKKAALLRPTAKPYGLKRIIEGDVTGDVVALIGSTDVPEEARELLPRLAAEFRLSLVDRVVPWTAPPLFLTATEDPPCAGGQIQEFASPAGYVLSSGLHRPSYFDVFTTLLDPAIGLQYAHRAGVEISSYDTIIGMAMGGIFLGATLALAAGRRPMCIDHGKVDDSLIGPEARLGKTLLVDETVGSGDYFRLATKKLSESASKCDYFVAARFTHRGDYEFPLLYGTQL